MSAVKPDPDSAARVGYMDDDFFEDTGEMTLPGPDTKPDVWLTRIPEWLYDAVANWDDIAQGHDDDQIEIGQVLAFNTTTGIDKSQPMRLFFNDRWRAKSNLPTAFDIEPVSVSDTVLGNTYVFTEKDLPGYRPNGLGNSYRPGGFGGYGNSDPKNRIQKRGRYRKAIPKQTALIGHATRQYSANPLSTKEYRDFDAQRIKQAIQGSYTETVIIKDPGVANYSDVQKRFETFIRPARLKPQSVKYHRISRGDLLDMLHACFDEFQYWPMKALKARTRQPEQFLKEVLPEMAQLVKSGHFASTWQRQQQFNIGRDIGQQQQAAPESLGAGDSGDDEEMEDVV